MTEKYLTPTGIPTPNYLPCNPVTVTTTLFQLRRCDDVSLWTGGDKPSKFGMEIINVPTRCVKRGAIQNLAASPMLCVLTGRKFGNRQFRESVLLSTYAPVIFRIRMLCYILTSFRRFASCDSYKQQYETISSF